MSGALGAAAVLFSLREGWLTLGSCTCLNLTASGRTDTCFALPGRDVGMRTPHCSLHRRRLDDLLCLWLFLLTIISSHSSSRKASCESSRGPGGSHWLLGWFLAIKGQTGGVVEVSLTFEGKTPSIHRLPESQPLGHVSIIYPWSIFICTHSQSQQIC